ncbi:MAG TPA: hypothetical protein VFS85_12535, partial [Dongiaceae bacterium]|nr:hypothetical protein [Dongiaceae bacterium]
GHGLRGIAFNNKQAGRGHWFRFQFRWQPPPACTMSDAYLDMAVCPLFCNRREIYGANPRLMHRCS